LLDTVLGAPVVFLIPFVAIIDNLSREIIDFFSQDRLVRFKADFLDAPVLLRRRGQRQVRMTSLVLPERGDVAEPEMFYRDGGVARRTPLRKSGANRGLGRERTAAPAALECSEGETPLDLPVRPAIEIVLLLPWACLADGVPEFRERGASDLVKIRGPMNAVLLRLKAGLTQQGNDEKAERRKPAGRQAARRGMGVQLFIQLVHPASLVALGCMMNDFPFIRATAQPIFFTAPHSRNRTKNLRAKPLLLLLSGL
jgi:hypothetical protein